VKLGNYKLASFAGESIGERFELGGYFVGFSD
jgi:hypothetical protein